MSESDTVTVPVQSSDGPAEVEVPAAAEAVVVASIEADDALRPTLSTAPAAEADGAPAADETPGADDALRGGGDARRASPPQR